MSGQILKFLGKFLPPETFNGYSLMVLHLYILFYVVLCPIIAKRHSDEMGTFTCAYVKSKEKDPIRTDCLNQFREQYDLSIPIYAVTILHLILVIIISIFYSMEAKIRMKEPHFVENSKLDACYQQRRKSSWLFDAYLTQMILKLVVGFIFSVLEIVYFLQHTDFPLNYDCEYRRTSLSRPVQQLNSHASVTEVSIVTSPETQRYSCTYQKDGIKSLFITFFCTLNIIFLVTLSYEIVHIWVRATREKHFKEDLFFSAVHIRCEDPVKLFITGLKNNVRQSRNLLRSVFPRYVEEGQKPHDIELDQIQYPRMVLYPKKVDYSTINENRQDLFREFLKESDSILEKPDDFFTAAKSGIILVVGSPGIGISAFCEKLLFDWANEKKFKKDDNGELYFDIAFLFRFRRFNKGEELTLHELLARAENSVTDDLQNSVVTYIQQNPSTVLFLFDGLDEFSDKMDLVDDNHYNAYSENDAMKKIPFPVLYRKLVSGKSLQGATVITTVGLNNFLSYRRLPFNATFEILEWTTDEVTKCVERCTSHTEQVKIELLKFICESTMLLSLCRIPAICSMVCSYLQQMLQFNSKLDTIPNLTKLYLGIFKMFILRNSAEYHDKIPSFREFSFETFPYSLSKKLIDLGKVAFRGISKGKAIFTEQEINGLQETGLLHSLQQNLFRFAHITMQEFLAAWYMVKGKDLKLKDIKKFFSDNLTRGKWQRVLQFVVGLLDDKGMQVNLLKDLFPSLTEMKTLSTEDADSEDLRQSMQICWPFKMDQTLALTWCKFLLECEQIDCRKDFCDVIDLSDSGLTYLDCKTVVLASQYICGDKVSRIRLNDNYIGRRGYRDIGELIHASKDLVALEIDGNNITDDGVKCLCLALSKSESKIKKLSLGRNKITNKSVQNLVQNLGECDLTHLNLSCNEITDDGVTQLASFLSTIPCKLSHLNLASNSIGEEGVDSLCKVLIEGECTLSYLNIANIAPMADEAIQKLFETLSKRECKLSQLNLSQNNINDTHVQFFSQSVLSEENFTLLHLNLSQNEITDAGVKHLSDALSERNCALKRLNLSGNSLITHEGVNNLCRVLHNLNQLGLDGVGIRYLGVKYLSQAIRRKKCQSLQLDLGSIGITKEGVMEISSALTKHDIELMLNLHDNELTDSDVEQLWSVFTSKKKHIKLELDLSKNSLTDKSIDELNKTLKGKGVKRCIVRSLNLSHNNLTDDSVRKIRELRKKMPKCKLDLTGNQISDKHVHKLTTTQVTTTFVDLSER